MINREEADAIAAAIRRGNRAHGNWSGVGNPHAFDDMDDLIDPDDPEDRAAFARTREGVAERNLGQLIAEQDRRLDAIEYDIAVDEHGNPLEPVTADELSEQIDALRAKRDANPAQFETLDFQLGQLVRRRATMNLAVLMEEQEERRQEELEEREAAREDATF